MEGTNKSGAKEFLRKFHCKINSLALAVLFLPILVYGASGVTLENSVVDRVATEVTLSFDGNIISYLSDSFDVKGALEEKSVLVGDFDVVEPSSDTKLSGGRVFVDVKRADRFLLDNDGVKSFIFSAYEEPEKILEQNNIEVFPEDLVSLELIFDFYGDNSLGKKIVIKRAPVIYVDVDGGRKELRSWENTLFEVLEEKGIIIGDKDKVTPERESFVTNKMEVTVVRVAESEAKETEIVLFGTQVINDYNLEIGKSYIKQAGVKGRNENTYKIIAENGIMVSKILISQVVISTTQNEIIVNGKKPKYASPQWSLLVEAGTKYGVDPSVLNKIMLCESGGNVYSTNLAGYYGLFQFSKSSWSKTPYANYDIYDPWAQINAASWWISRNGTASWPNCD